MQIDPALARIPPGPEGIVAQDKLHAIDAHLGIRLDALPAIAANDSGVVNVAGDKVFAAMQRLQEGCYALWPLAEGEVAEVPDLSSAPTTEFQQWIIWRSISAMDAKGRR